VPAAIERCQSEVKGLTRGQRDLRQEVSQFRATALRDRAEAIQGFARIVLSDVPGWDAAALKALAAAICSEPGHVAVLVGEGTPAPVVIARSSDVVFDVGAWLKAATQALGGRGGGRPEQAQGGIPAEAGRILAYARKTLSG
jgi:alanyl-tRNA synthetase